VQCSAPVAAVGLDSSPQLSVNVWHKQTALHCTALHCTAFSALHSTMVRLSPRSHFALMCDMSFLRVSAWSRGGSLRFDGFFDGFSLIAFASAITSLSLSRRLPVIGTAGSASTESACTTMVGGAGGGGGGGILPTPRRASLPPPAFFCRPYTE
jgi:hypothetical protein